MSVPTPRSLGPKPRPARVRVNLGNGKFVFGRLVHVTSDGLATVRLPKGVKQGVGPNPETGAPEDRKTLQVGDENIRIKHHRGVQDG